MTPSMISISRSLRLILPSSPPRNNAPCGSTTARRPVFSAIEQTMCCTQAKSPLLPVGIPAKARPQGSLSQISRTHCLRLKGGLEMTRSNLARPPVLGSVLEGRCVMFLWRRVVNQHQNHIIVSDGVFSLLILPNSFSKCHRYLRSIYPLFLQIRTCCYRSEQEYYILQI